jgi:ATP phosphoribosyltransferase
MEPLDLIADVSSRLVVNKAALKMKHHRIEQVVEKIAAAVIAKRS